MIRPRHSPKPIDAKPSGLALAGEHDNGVRKEIVAQVFPQVFSGSKVTVEVLANSGHYSMEEIPIHLTTRVEKFLSDTNRR